MRIYMLIKYAGLYEELVGTYETREEAEKMMNRLIEEERVYAKYMQETEPYYSGYEYAINELEIFE